MFIMITFLLIVFLSVYAEPDHISDLNYDKEKAFSSVDSVSLYSICADKQNDAGKHDD